MRLGIKKDNGIERLYIEKSIRISDKKVTTQSIEKLGRVDEFMKSMELSHEEVIAWTKKKVDDLNASSAPMLLSLSPSKSIASGERRSFRAGYLFLQDIYYSIKTKNIFRNIAKRHRYKFDLNAITSDLIYARILEPNSKRTSYEVAKSFLEKSSYEEHDIYRGLSVLAQEMDYIQAEVYKNSHFISQGITVSFITTAATSTLKAGRRMNSANTAKARRTGPIPSCRRGSSWTGTVYRSLDGAANEQPSLKPSEKKLFQDFWFEKFERRPHPCYG